MSRYDVVVIGAGLGGLTAAALLARAGRKVLLIERSNSVGGAASSYKVGDLFVEGSLHETADPHDPRDPKHHILTRAGVIDAVQWIPAGSLYEVRGGPFAQPFTLPDSFDGAKQALGLRFPDARETIATLLDEMAQVAAAAGTLARGRAAFRNPAEALTAIFRLRPAIRDWRLSLAQKLDRVFGGNEPVKLALAANLAYYHDDPATLWWPYFAIAQGGYLQGGGRFIHGGSQRLSSALARAVRTAGGEVLVRRAASRIDIDGRGAIRGVTHTARDGSDPKSVETTCVVSGAAPMAITPMLADPRAAGRLNEAYGSREPSISLFALTLGLSKPPRDFGVTSYSTQLLPEGMTRLIDYAAGTRLMAGEPDGRMPPLAIVDYAAIDSGVPAPPHVLSVIGADHIDNWRDATTEAYRARRDRWKDAIIGHLDRHFPGIAGAVVASSFNTAHSVQQYLNAPSGAVYGFAPTPPRLLRDRHTRSPRTPLPGLYLASAYAGFGGYTGTIQAAGACADMILGE